MYAYIIRFDILTHVYLHQRTIILLPRIRLILLRLCTFFTFLLFLAFTFHSDISIIAFSSTNKGSTSLWNNLNPIVFYTSQAVSTIFSCTTITAFMAFLAVVILCISCLDKIMVRFTFFLLLAFAFHSDIPIITFSSTNKGSWGLRNNLNQIVFSHI